MQGTGLQVIPRGAFVSCTSEMVNSRLTTKIDYPPVDGLARVFHSTNALNLELLRSTLAHIFMAFLPLDVHTVQPLFVLISIYRGYTTLLTITDACHGQLTLVA